MRNSLRLATGAAVFGVVTLVGAPAALAQTATCSSYAKACVSESVAGTAGSAGTAANRASVTRSAPSTLPFTGSETAAIGLGGAGAIAAGALLVVATRRRAVPTT